MERVEPFPTLQASKVAYRKRKQKPMGRPPKNAAVPVKKTQQLQRRHYTGRTSWTKQTYNYVKMVTKGKGAPCKIWTMTEKKQLLEGLKRYSQQDWDSICKCVPTRTHEEIKEFIHRLKGGDQHKSRANRDVQLSWAPIESWADMSVEMVHYEQSDLSKVLSRAFSILGNFSQFPPCISPNLEPDYGKLYRYLAAVMDESLSMPELTPLESAIIADLMHGISDKLRMSDTSLQRKVMCWKYKMLNHKFDFDNVGVTLDRIRKALTNDFSDLQKDSSRNVSELPSFSQSSDSNATQETSVTREAESARPPNIEAPIKRRGRPPSNWRRPEWRRQIEKPRLYAMNPFCVPIRLLHLKPLLTDNTTVLRRPASPRSTSSRTKSATSSGSRLSIHRQQRDRDIQKAARRAQEANKLRQVTGIYVPETSKKKKKQSVTIDKPNSVVQSQVSSTTLNAMRAALLQKKQPVSSPTTTATATVQPAPVIVLAGEKGTDSNSGSDPAQVYRCIELPGGKKGLIPCETPVAEEGLDSLPVSSSSQEDVEMPPPLPPPPPPTSMQHRAGQHHSAAPSSFTLCISPSLFRSPLRAPVAGCSVSVGTSDDEEDLAVPSHRVVRSFSLHQPSTSSASAKQKSFPRKLLQRQHSAPSRQGSAANAGSGDTHKRKKPVKKASPKPSKKQLGPQVTASLSGNFDSDPRSNGFGSTSTSKLPTGETANSVFPTASPAERGTGIAAHSCFSHPTSVLAANISSESTQANDSDGCLQATEGHSVGNSIQFTSEGKYIGVAVATATAVPTLINIGSSNLSCESQYSPNDHGDRLGLQYSQTSHPSSAKCTDSRSIPVKPKIQQLHLVKQKESQPPQPDSQNEVQSPQTEPPQPVSQKGFQSSQPVSQNGVQHPQPVNQEGPQSSQTPRQNGLQQPQSISWKGSQPLQPVSQKGSQSLQSDQHRSQESQPVRKNDTCLQKTSLPLHKQKQLKPPQRKNNIQPKASQSKTPSTQPSASPKPANPIIPTIINATYKKRVRQYKPHVEPTIQEIIVRPPSTHTSLIEKVKPPGESSTIQPVSSQQLVLLSSQRSGRSTVQQLSRADQARSASKLIIPRGGAESDLDKSQGSVGQHTSLEPRRVTPSSSPPARNGQAVVIRTSSNSRFNPMSKADWSVKVKSPLKDHEADSSKLTERVASLNDDGGSSIGHMKTYSRGKKTSVMVNEVTSQTGNTNNLGSVQGANGSPAGYHQTMVVKNSPKGAAGQKILQPTAVVRETHSTMTVSSAMPQSVHIVPMMSQSGHVDFMSHSRHVIPQSDTLGPAVSQSKGTKVKSSTSKAIVSKCMQSTCSAQTKPHSLKSGPIVYQPLNLTQKAQSVSQKTPQPRANVIQSVASAHAACDTSSMDPVSDSFQLHTNGADLMKMISPVSTDQMKGMKSSFKTILSQVATPHTDKFNPTTPKQAARVEMQLSPSPSSSLSPSPTPSKKLKLTNMFPAKRVPATETKVKKRGRKPKEGKVQEDSYPRAKKRPANFLSEEDISGKEMIYVTLETAQKRLKTSVCSPGTEDYEAEIQQRLDTAKKFGRQPLQMMMDDEEISLVSI